MSPTVPAGRAGAIRGPSTPKTTGNRKQSPAVKGISRDLITMCRAGRLQVELLYSGFTFPHPEEAIPTPKKREEMRKYKKQHKKPQPTRSLGEPSPQGDPGGVSAGPSPDRSKPADQPPTNPRSQTTQTRGRDRQSRERGSSQGQAVDGSKPDATGAQTARAAY